MSTTEKKQIRCHVIPVEGPVQEIDLVSDEASQLTILQALVGGYIEAVTCRRFGSDVTCYIDEESKFTQPVINRRATDIMLSSMFPGDYITGPFVICGFDPQSGEHVDLPELPAFAKLVIDEAG